MQQFTDNLKNKNIKDVILDKNIKLAMESDGQLISICCKELSVVIDAIKNRLNTESIYNGSLKLSDFKSVNDNIDNENKVFILNHSPEYDKNFYNEVTHFFNGNNANGCKIFILFKEDEIDDELLSIFLSDNFFNIYTNLKTKNHKKPLINEILGSCDGVEGIKKYHPALYLAISFMIKNIYNDITLEEVSKASYVSSSHLSYLFRTKLNTKFKSVMFILKVNEARKLIKDNPRESLTNIAVKVGFNDLSHFGKTFKKHEGLSLGQFRKSLNY